jgi:signal transduction histidine kinase
VTGRILASFLAVLLAVIAAIVLPLGVVLSSQQRRDFRDGTAASARSLAALTEEQLDDRKTTVRLPDLLSRAVAPGDVVAVLDTSGGLVAGFGGPLPALILAAARSQRALPQLAGRVVVEEPVGNPSKPVGTVVLSRLTQPVQARTRDLWLALASASLAAVVIGTIVGLALARWISRPLRTLSVAARTVGRGAVSGSRADATIGPTQVREVAAAFNDMADRVASLLEAQLRMTADVSHQLRTPLAALRLRLELLRDDVGEPFGDQVTAMLVETARLSRLVDGLLAVARAEAAVSVPHAIDVAAICAERIAAWEPLATERGVRAQLDAAPVVASLTPGHLEQILDNLLANAMDYVSAGGQVTVSLDAEDRDVVVRVIDTGPGMSSTHRANAFARFVTDRSGHGGTGLGLAIVDRLLSADHGSAALEDTPDGGLTVVLRLPKIESTAGAGTPRS